VLQRSRDKRKLQSKLESLEAKIAETETQLATIEGRLSAPASPDSAIADAKLYEQTGKALEELMTEWETMAGQIDALD
jgi:phage shock protein A